MKKCFCGQPVEGTLLTYYHDGTLLYADLVCADCGTRHDNRNEVHVSWELRQLDLRLQEYVHGSFDTSGARE